VSAVEGTVLGAVLARFGAFLARFDAFHAACRRFPEREMITHGSRLAQYGRHFSP
jgi:hypothetical protein